VPKTPLEVKVGRNYIREWTIADPKARAADKAARKRASAKRLKAEQAALAAYLERVKWCANGCGQLAALGEGNWMGCCSEACFWQREEAVKVQADARRARLARRQG
jgi:hypothetical protein